MEDMTKWHPPMAYPEQGGGLDWQKLLGLGTGNPLAFLSMLSPLLGMFSHYDPMRELNRRWQAGVTKLPTMTRQAYLGNVNSPAFTTAQTGMIQSNQALQNALASSLGASGLTKTGIGAVAVPLAASQLGGQLGGLHTQAWNQGAQSALEQLKYSIGMMPQNQYGGLWQYGGMEKLAALMAALARMPTLYPTSYRSYQPYQGGASNG
jgi:hypothetical protein